jgi:hypothetical protein
LGVGVLGFGFWPQTPIPNPQSPIPNPQSPCKKNKILLIINIKINIPINKIIKYEKPLFNNF